MNEHEKATAVQQKGQPFFQISVAPSHFQHFSSLAWSLVYVSTCSKVKLSETQWFKMIFACSGELPWCCIKILGALGLQGSRQESWQTPKGLASNLSWIFENTEKSIAYTEGFSTLPQDEQGVLVNGNQLLNWSAEWKYIATVIYLQVLSLAGITTQGR